MKQKSVRFGLISVILAIMIVTNLNIQSIEANPGDIWVTNGTTVTFVLDGFQLDGNDTVTSVASDKVSGMDLMVTQGAEYNITITNDTVRSESGSYYIDVEFDNGTHTVIENNNLV